MLAAARFRGATVAGSAALEPASHNHCQVKNIRLSKSLAHPEATDFSDKIYLSLAGRWLGVVLAATFRLPGCATMGSIKPLASSVCQAALNQLH